MKREDSGNVIAMHADKRPLSCRSCPMRSACLPAGMDDADTDRVERLVTHRYGLARGEDLHRVNEPVRGLLYAIRSGQFKCYRLTAAGEQRIAALPGGGALLGLDGLGLARHPSTATATTDSVLCELSYAKLLAAAREFPALESRLERMLGTELARQQSVAVLLGYQCAEQKIACFLLELAWARPQHDANSTCVDLPLTRQDIGDYLGLSGATVTRQLLRLRRMGVLRVERRHIGLVDRPRLEQMAAGRDGGPRQRPRLAAG